MTPRSPVVNPDLVRETARMVGDAASIAPGIDVIMGDRMRGTSAVDGQAS